MAEYRVRLAVFEGPLDLLLHLIEREEVDIWEVSMAEIADQYLTFLSELHEVELESAGDYVATAALLVRIKARHLLPYAEPSEDDEEDDDEVDFEEALKRQLVEYRRFKEASAQLAEMAAARAQHTLRPLPLAAPAPAGRALPPPDFDVALLTEAFVALLAKAPPPPKPPPLLRKVDLPERIEFVRKKVGQTGGGVRFSSLFDAGSSRWEWIVTFLAVLELVHKSEIVVRQRTPLGELHLCLAPAEG